MTERVSDTAEPSPAEGEDRSELDVSKRQLVLVSVGSLLVVAGVGAALLLGRQDAQEGLIGLAGLVTLSFGLYYGARGLFDAEDPIQFPPVHTRNGVRRAGAAFETSVARIRDDESEQAGPIEWKIETSLRDLATDVLAAEQGLDEVTARRQLANGTWTDDPDAAELFQETRRGSFFRGTASTKSFPERVENAVDGIASLTLGTDEPREWLDDPDPRTSSRPWQSGVHPTGYWRGIASLGLCALGTAAVFQASGLVLVAGLLLGIAGYVRIGSAPTPSLAVEREFDTEGPRPGDPVEVTVTVTNDGGTLLPDLRLADGVPDRLAVVGGTPRHVTALPPGESTTFSYDVLAVYGEHAFDSIHVASRGTTGQHERTSTEGTAVSTLTCEPVGIHESVPLRPQETGVTGRVPSEVGGSGQEFWSVREYRRGDPLRRIDWNRVARTGELGTLEFREEHAATVVVLVDSRASAFRSPSLESLSAVERSLAGAAQLFATLENDGDRVGLASIGHDWLWIGPGAGSEHRARVQSALQHDPSFEPRDWERFRTVEYVRQLRGRLPANAQLVVFSPLLDDAIVETIQRLAVHGYELTVFSPDPTRTDTVGGTVTHLERQFALSSLRKSEIRIVDWQRDETLEAAVGRAARRWNR